MKKDNIVLLKWMQSQDRNGDYLEKPLPPIQYAIDTIKEWIKEYNADVPYCIMTIINKY